MGLIQDLMRGAAAIRGETTGSPAPWSDYWYEPLGTSSSSGMRINAASAQRIATVLACVGVIGRSVGMLPCKIYTEGPNGAKRAVDYHPLYDVLARRPNKNQTAFEFWQMMQGHIELRGNAYAEIIPGKRGAVDQLVPMHPDRVRVEQLRPSGRLRYVYQDPLTGRERKLLGPPDSEVFHIRNNSENGLVGQSTVSLGADVFGVALARQDYAARFLQNDARPPAVFSGGNFKSKADEQRFLDSWQEGNAGGNRGKTGLLPPGMTLQELGVKPVDAQLLDGMKFSRMEIISMFGVPPHLVGELDKAATYASVEQFNIMYVVYSLLPRIVMIEQAIQRDLITNDRYYPKFSVGSLLRGDTESRYEAYASAIQNGWMCPDEPRALEDLNPIPGGVGQTFWRPAAWSPLAQTTSGTASNAQRLPDPQDTGDDGSDAQPDNSAMLRLQVLASAAADRCMRKETAALRKFAERGASDYEIESFYHDHLRFVSEVMNLDEDQKLEAGQSLFERAGEFRAALATKGKADALAFVDALAVKATTELAKMAAEGAK